MHEKSFTALARVAVLAVLCLVSRSSPAEQDKPEPPREAAALPSHPVVVGFERFGAEANGDSSMGRLLLGELNCTACHKAEGDRAKQIATKTAPILDGVGGRVRLEHIVQFLSNPQRTKPGTTMPDVFATTPESEKHEQIAALASFLAQTGAVEDQMADSSAVRRGEELFHRAGCVACHNPQRTEAPSWATSVPLGDVLAKYTLPSLARFIREPLAVRPSGRMPDLNLNDKEALDVASYFLRGISLPPNVKFAYYEGNWDKLPDFSSLRPMATGEASGFDLHVTKRTSNFAIRFEGCLHIQKPGNYTFHLSSDDGSRLLIDGKQVVDNDGIHPTSSKSENANLAEGVHPIVVDFFQGGGEWVLSLEYEGPGVPRQAVASAVTLTAAKPQPHVKEPRGFVPQPELVETGRKLFATLGCAACHQLKENNKLIPSELAAPVFGQLKPEGGCLAQTPTKAVPDFRLSEPQRSALRLALAQLQSPDAIPPPTPQQSIAATMMTFNCFACHERDKTGGVETERNELFQTTIQEMGDEGRIPPHLNGAGDKLQADWLKHLFANGAKDRPYMHTRMPKFGMPNVGHLVEAFAAADAKTLAEIPDVDLPPHRVKSAARFLVGDQALSCIKCHNFEKYVATGIQAIDLTTMTKRLRHDWFHRYMLNPQVYRPGTRMPAAWPFGQATIRDVLDGDAGKQLHAVWIYLSDGAKAAIPSGLIRDPIVLVPDKEPIIYRNFIEGAGPRGIAVGYPEKANLAFDADKLRLALIWHNDFIDASLHWSGRGPGFQIPLGDHVVSLADGVSFAHLESPDAAWPGKSAKELGYQFRGYRLDRARRPTFLYNLRGAAVEDFPQPVAGDKEPSLRRTLTLTAANAHNVAAGSNAPASEAPGQLWYRAATGNDIQAQDGGWFLINGVFKTHIEASAEPRLRNSGNQFELLVPLELTERPTRIIQQYVW